ncbi:sugar 3,4-ketoisomerase [Fulvimarina endophytica]|nr:FdtA/QdtA family cupin domain-containing protein [Fulvimarina endophytica]
MNQSIHVPTDDLGSEAGASKSVGPATLVRLPRFDDARGSLIPLQDGRGLPFSPSRIFMVFGVGEGLSRGEHAHIVCQQFLIAAAGSVKIIVGDGTHAWDVLLDDPGMGVHLPAMTWGTQRDYSEGAVLLVAASHLYDAADYIHDYEEYRAAVAARGRAGAAG